MNTPPPSQPSKVSRKRKTSAPKKYGFKQLKRVPRPVTRIGLPDRFCVKLRYFDTVAVSAASTGTAGYYVFRANSVYDPDYSGAGHQPRGFDQLMQLYNSFTVIHSEIRVQFTSDLTGTNAAIAGVSLSTDLPISVNPTDLMEMRGVKTIAMKQNTTPFPGYVVERFSAKKLSGVANLMDDDNQKGSPSANPSRIWYYNVFCFNPGAAVTPAITVDANVTIDYTVVFTDQTIPSES